MKSEKYIISGFIFLTLILTCSIIFLVVQNHNIKEIIDYSEKLQIGKKGHIFTANSITGNKINIKNKQTLLIFFNTTCSRCIESAKEWQQLSNKYFGKGLLLVGISSDNRFYVNKFLRRINLTFPIIIDADKTITLNYKVKTYPFFVLMNNKNKILYFNQNKSKIKDIFRDIEEHIPN